MDFEQVLGNAYGATTYLPITLLPSQRRIANHSFTVIFQITEVETPRSRNTYLVYFSMPYGTLPETPPKVLKSFVYRYNTKYIQVIHNSLRILAGDILNKTKLSEVTTGYTQLTKYSQY